MKSSYLEIDLRGESFYLLPQKALFRPEEKQLILSDLHFGKSAHFRKHGIPMPVQSHLKDFDLLRYLLTSWQPQTVLFLGDLFHSHHNREWWWLKSLLMEHDHIGFMLVEGNHDILPETYYDLPNLWKATRIEDERFIFSHDPLPPSHRLNICGHIHPGIRISGPAKQSHSFACFYRSASHFILPAFGHLTGLKLLEREHDADYYLIGDQSVIKL